MRLLEVISIPPNDMSEYKLHLAIGAKDKKEPLYELAKSIDSFKLWQEEQSKKNFERDFILALIYYKPDEWIFGGVYRRLGVKKIANKYMYETELLDVRTELIGRLIVRFRRPGRQSYLYLENWADKIEVVEILREPYSVAPFPGYENVIIDFNLLKTIIDKEEISWKAGLSSVKGVYIITDKTNGKKYVGVAYGEDSFWSRWASYAKSGHGENKELKDLIQSMGIEYASNFQFAILEIITNTASDQELIEREEHWKKVFMSRQFGYNRN
ncbi:group I intron endonuclease [Thermosyntropha lipolytica DSM 11003]|uniref:Group I intron endonuclease n=2 Tax=Thermosyntropha TaxID=54293 RepID=A0A1M5SF97_9FIRM|nr:group I intron endonuclease [Thermosyntropha lipolytica DSM 11003]